MKEISYIILKELKEIKELTQTLDENMEKRLDERFEKFSEDKNTQFIKLIDQRFEKFSEEIAIELQEIIIAIQKKDIIFNKRLKVYYDESIKRYTSNEGRIRKLEEYQKRIKFAVLHLQNT